MAGVPYGFQIGPYVPPPNPCGYGQASYISSKPKKEEKPKKLAPGAIVSWRTRDGRYGVGVVLQDWGDYGLQVEVEGPNDQKTRLRLNSGEAEHISLLDALARSSM